MDTTILICICLAGGCFVAAMTCALGFLLALLAEGRADVGSKWSGMWSSMQVFFIALMVVFLTATAGATVPIVCIQYQNDHGSKSAE